jgi:hypothetical protein
MLSAATPADFAALSNNANFQRQMGSVLTKFANNLAGIAEIIKTDAPDARVIFLKQYNPMKNVLGFGDFGNFADTLIAQINTSIDQVCAASGFEVLDAPSVIDVNAVGLTNMLNYDIHPNAAGHLEIAKLLASHLGVSLDEPVDTTEAPEETTLAPTDTTNVPENNTQAPDDATNAPEGTDTIDTTDNSVLDPEPAVKKGCISSVSAIAVILTSLCALAIVKKKN